MEEILFNEKFKNFRIEKIKREEHYSMNINHFHSYYEIYYLLSGERYYFIGNRNNYVKKGGFVIVDSNQIHKTSDAGELGHERILLEIDAALLKDIDAFFSDLYFETCLFGRSGVVNLEIPEQSMVEDILYSIMYEMEKRETGYVGVVKAKLIELFTFIIRKLDKKDIMTSNHADAPQNQKVQEIADYISAHYSEFLSLDSLSEKFYISKYYLCHVFKKYMSFTIDEYINTNRMMQAKKLLLESKNSITQIAEVTGYGSATNFGKIFKHYMGKAPLEYRKAYQGK